LDLHGLEIASRAFLVAWPKCRPRTRCPLLAAIPPQDSKDCHVSDNVFVSFDGFETVSLCNIFSQKAMKSLLLWRGLLFCLIIRGFAPRACEVLSVGARQRTLGCSPKALEEWEHSSKGCKHNVCTVDWATGPLSIRFSRPRHYFSRHQHFFQLVG